MKLIIDTWANAHEGHFEFFNSKVRLFAQENEYVFVSEKVGILRKLIAIFKAGEIFMPNFCVASRNHMTENFVFFLFFYKCVTVCHSVSKIHFLNWLYVFLAKPGSISVFGHGLKNYFDNLLRNKCKLAHFPNLDQLDYNGGINRDSGLAIIWGGAASTNTCITKFKRHALFLKMVLRIETILITQNMPKATVEDIKKLDFKVLIKNLENSSDLENALAKATYSILFLTDDYDYYEKKGAASGVLLTNKKFELITIADFRLGGVAFDFGPSDIRLYSNDVETAVDLFAG